MRCVLYPHSIAYFYQRAAHIQWINASQFKAICISCTFSYIGKRRGIQVKLIIICKILHTLYHAVVCFRPVAYMIHGAACRRDLQNLFALTQAYDGRKDPCSVAVCLPVGDEAVVIACSIISAAFHHLRSRTARLQTVKIKCSVPLISRPAVVHSAVIRCRYFLHHLQHRTIVFHTVKHQVVDVRKDKICRRCR